MVTITPIPSAAPSAVEVPLLATFKEKLCKPFCIDSSLQPQVSVVYTTRPPKHDGSTVFVPVTAVITVVTPGCKCNAKVQLFTENFEVAFQGQLSLPTAVFVESKGRIMGGADVKCGCAHSYKVSDSLVVFINPVEEEK